MPDVFAEPCYIMSTHRYQYRSGEWAEIVGVKLANKSPCYLVLFPDGKTDLWVLDDETAEYKFSAKRFKVEHE